MKTYMAKASTVQQGWYVVDAKDQVVGRLATKIARVLMGKHKPTYTPHLDTGDFVIITNADKVRFTGKKMTDKVYHHYTGYLSGHRETQVSEMLESHPERVLTLAIKRMLPKSALGRNMLKKLKIYAGDAHPHAAQDPQPLDLSRI